MGSTDQPVELPNSTPSTKPALKATGGLDGFGGYGKSFLRDGVGRGQANQPDDVHLVSTFLTDNRLLERPTREPHEPFLRAIEKAQTKLNGLAGGGLQVDGIVKPFGPTEVLSQRAVTSEQMRPPAGKIPGFPNIGGPPEEGFDSNALDDFFQKFNLFLKSFRDDEIPFMGKVPTGGVSNKKRG